MKLYHHPLSTYSQKALAALYEKELEFESEHVMLMDPEARERYLKVYPLGKIPLLLSDGEMVPESSIIIEWLDARFPATPRLVPADPERSRRTRFMDRMMDLYLDDNVATLVFQSWKPAAERDAERIDKAQFQIGVTYDYMDKALAGGNWLMGEEFTLADIAAAPPLFYAGRFAPFEDRPAISAYWQRLQARPSVARVISEVLPHLQALEERRSSAAR